MQGGGRPGICFSIPDQNKGGHILFIQPVFLKQEFALFALEGTQPEFFMRIVFDHFLHSGIAKIANTVKENNWFFEVCGFHKNCVIQS
jgi:hypothetical protein